MSSKQFRDALFRKLIKFNEQQLSDLLFAANCIEEGIEAYNRKVEEVEKLRFALSAYRKSGN